MGDHAMLRAPAGGRDDRARRVHARLGPLTAQIIEHGGLFAVHQGARARRGQAAAAGTGAAADDHGREDPRRATSSTAQRRRYVKPGDAGAACASTAATRTSSRPRRCTPSSPRSTAPTTRSPTRRSSPSSRTTSSTPTACRDGAVLAEDPDAARHAARVPAADRRAGLLGASRRRVARHLPHRSRASSSSIRATSSRPPTSHTCMGGAVGRARLRRRRHRVRGARSTPGFTFVVGARVDPLRAHRPAAPGRHRQGRDALHPRQPRQAAAHARPRDGVRRRRACARCRPTSARRSPTWRPSARPRRGMVEVDDAMLAWIAARRPGVDVDDAAREGRRARSPARSYAGGVHAIDLVDDPRRWWRRPAIREAASRRDPTNGALRRRARRRAASTSPTAARAPPARETTSTCTRA